MGLSDQDVENRDESLLEPFVAQQKGTQHDSDSLGMVLFSTGIAVSGSFVFGCAVSIPGN